MDGEGISPHKIESIKIDNFQNIQSLVYEVVILIISESGFVYLIFFSLIGGVTSFIIMICLISFERKLELIDIEKDRIKLEASLKEAKFLHLSSQIKPHFLFNVLGTIISLLYFKKISKAMSTVYSLSRMLRYTADIKEMCTLQQECLYLKDYLDIQKVRFGDRLVFELDLEERLQGMQVPSLCLQPIVENVCKHCMEEDDNPIAILVKGLVDDEKVQIMIQDNGKGMALEKINTFYETRNKPGQEDQDQHHQHHEHQVAGGVGLVNVHKRITYHFGTEYGLDISSEHGTKVTLTFPKKERWDHE
jgi:sensor histidine kinase YesM